MFGIIPDNINVTGADFISRTFRNDTIYTRVSLEVSTTNLREFQVSDVISSMTPRLQDGALTEPLRNVPIVQDTIKTVNDLASISKLIYSRKLFGKH